MSYHIIRHSNNSSRSSAVTIVTRVQAARSAGSNPGTVKRFLCSPHRLYRKGGSPSLLFNGYRSAFPGVQRPGREVEHSPTTNAEVTCSYTSTPPICLHRADSENFTVFTFIFFHTVRCHVIREVFDHHNFQIVTCLRS